MAEELVFFGTGANQFTIWKSDGTSSGTKPLINASVLGDDYGSGDYGSGHTVPGPILFYANNKIYAQGLDSSGANLLVWNTQGYNIFNSSGNLASALTPQAFAAYDGRVYFNGRYQKHTSQLEPTNELFSTDGTAGGTTATSNSDLSPGSLAVAFGKLFFSGNNGSDNVLYAYEGGQAAPVGGAGFDDLFNPRYLTVSVVGKELAFEFPTPHLSPPASLFMSGQDSTGATWLYRYDGANLTKIVPASLSGSPSGLQPYNLNGLVWPAGIEAPGYQSALFFSGVNANNQYGLWMSGGTSETTREIDLPLPSGGDANSSVYPFNITAFEGNGMLYFTGYDTYINGFPSKRGLFVYEPMENHVGHIIKSSEAQLDPGFNTDWEGPSFFNQTTMTVFNNDLYFSAQAGTGAESVPNLWQANLNSQGTGAAPAPVYLESGGLEPYSLTTAEL